VAVVVIVVGLLIWEVPSLFGQKEKSAAASQDLNGYAPTAQPESQPGHP
jgi:hypothetical protein